MKTSVEESIRAIKRHHTTAPDAHILTRDEWERHWENIRQKAAAGVKAAIKFLNGRGFLK